jgi:hypothetical protein
VDKDGTRPDPDLLKGLKEFPSPKNRTDLKSFMGLAEQVGTYTNQKAMLIGPLRPHLVAGPWKWDGAAEQAFLKAREEMTHTAKLARYDSTKDIELHTDASKLHGYGFILFQLEEDGSRKILEAGSRCLTDAETRYAVVEIEMGASVWAMNKCRLFITGRDFELVTDPQPLVGVYDKALSSHLNTRLANMAAKVSHLTFTIRWEAGKTQLADGLSRCPVDIPEPEEYELGSSEGIATVANVLVAKPDARTSDAMGVLKRESLRAPVACPL